MSRKKDHLNLESAGLEFEKFLDPTRNRPKSTHLGKMVRFDFINVANITSIMVTITIARSSEIILYWAILKSFIIDKVINY